MSVGTFDLGAPSWLAASVAPASGSGKPFFFEVCGNAVDDAGQCFPRPQSAAGSVPEENGRVGELWAPLIRKSDLEGTSEQDG